MIWSLFKGIGGGAILGIAAVALLYWVAWLAFT